MSVGKPRTKGFLSHACRVRLNHGLCSTLMEPSGVRTASAYTSPLRIMTPSMTACPPTSGAGARKGMSRPNHVRGRLGAEAGTAETALAPEGMGMEGPRNAAP